ncbi:MAG: hypothetical protein WCJ19_01965 [bacterium]
MPSYQQQPINQAPNFQQDILTAIISKAKKNPGKTGYFFALFLSLLFTFFPWTGVNMTGKANISNYYSFISDSTFSIIYIIALISLVFIRIIIWRNFKAFLPYRKLLEFIEVLFLGASVMFVLTFVGSSTAQIGLFFSIITNLYVLGYISYLKFIK